MTNRKAFAILVSAILLCALWQALSLSIGSSLILPSISDVIQDSAKLLIDRSFLDDVFATLMRGLLAFTVSFALSLVLGVLSGISPIVRAFLVPWMAVIKSTPVVAFILIAILWFGSTIVPVFVAVLMTLPVMTEAAAQGVRASDRKLLDMARIYRMPQRTVLFDIRIPSAAPYILAGAGASIGLTWKVVIAGEILGFPHAGIGSAMQIAKVHLETPRVFSLTIVAILVSSVTETAFHLLAKVTSRHARMMADSGEGAL